MHVHRADGPLRPSPMRPFLSLLLLALAGAVPPPPAGAEPVGAALQVGAEAPPPTPGRPSGRLRVTLLTMDQGDEVWERFGHNALLIEDEVTGESLTWNWGLFDFDDVDFLPRFLRGTMRYAMGPAPLEPFLRSYERAGRTVYANEVHLTDAQARELDAFVRWNYLPEHRHYTYDYFRDNCSTRIRDVLDRVLGGAIRTAFVDRGTPHSYRWHSRRLVQETLWIDQGLSFLLGTRGDRPITEWEAMFVPMELMELLEGLEVDDGEGVARPLLGPRQVVYRAPRGPAPDEAPSFHWGWLLAGLLLGALAVGAGTAVRRSGADRTGARLALVLFGAAWSLFAGALGLLLVLAWFTDHTFIHWNVNVLYASPLLLALAPALAVAGHRPEWWRGRPGFVVLALVVLVAGLSILAALVQLAGMVRQGNPEVVALALPLNVGLAAAVVRSRAGRSSARRRTGIA